MLVHGGGFDARCWDLMLPHLRHEAVAVDLPGRGGVLPPRREVTVSDFVAHVAGVITERDLRNVVLVGHSMAGITIPGVADRTPERIAHLVFVSCTVPADGASVMGSLDVDVDSLASGGAGPGAESGSGSESGSLDPALAEAIFCNDMDEAQRAWTVARLVPEAPGVITEAVDQRGLRRPIPRTWVRLLQDVIIPPEQQDRFAETVGGCRVVELNAAHMAMISRPAELAAILDGVADREAGGGQ
ncbi:MAG TPA: alpha/beta hydrolase [Acidimicrobiales bacterium]